ncbi:kinesin-like protein [Favolaschia claudopus]|uniref:Kinesin-like protein n=1 Tax=Favolaschia claudopus TaxID=2862362 RepID=A0AAW0CY14_9AGAR
MATKVRIAARLRPRLTGEPPDDGGVLICRAEANTSGSSSSLPHNNPNNSANSSSSSSGGSFTGLTVANPRDASQIFRFPFTSCYDAEATQEEIFNADVLPLIDIAWSGITVTIFAYGVTSSGKTHTMQGPPDDPGVIPRVVEALFAKTLSRETEGETTEIAVSYIEIYKDDVFDLLVSRENAPKLPVRENESGMVFVAGLTRTPIASVAEFETIYSTATARRSVGATLLNRASSRSHAVLTLEIRTRISDPATGATKLREGKINLVDLAGSENNKLTGNDPARMAESAAINKSLSVLGQVVHALNTGAPRIPYRNAKLTRILQDALGGSSVGLLICNLSPAAKFRQDTLNTLNFAVRTKNIENKPVVNERDVRPPQPVKLDLANPPVPAPKPVAAVGTRPGARPSLVPRPTGAGAYQSSSRAESRLSMVGRGATSAALEKMPPGLSEAEIDARIAKAVEAEVARRMEEKEKERQRELEEEKERERAKEKEAGSSRQRTKSPKRSPKTKARDLPAGLTPLLKRHKDLDDELQSRLAELERKFERGNGDAGLADVLSPVSKKKTGRAYVALARAHSEQGNLQVALDLYRRAETYVPDNVKLKERWILFVVHVFLCSLASSASPSAPPSRAASRASRSRAASESVPGVAPALASVPAATVAASKVVSTSRIAAAVSALKRTSLARVSASGSGSRSTVAGTSGRAHGKAIIEIEWAVKNEKAFKPSPKRAKKAKKVKSKVKEVEETEMDVDIASRAQSEKATDAGQESDDQMEVDEVESSLTGAFGRELTNTGSKRGLAEAGMETPVKRPKGKKQRVVVIESDEEYEPGAAPRKNRRRVATAA